MSEIVKPLLLKFFITQVSALADFELIKIYGLQGGSQVFLLYESLLQKR